MCLIMYNPYQRPNHIAPNSLVASRLWLAKPKSVVALIYVEFWLHYNINSLTIHNFQTMSTIFFFYLTPNQSKPLLPATKVKSNVFTYFPFE